MHLFYLNLKKIKVCSGTTGHNEVVQVEYNTSIINTEKLLQIFFFLHDPTQLNRQGILSQKLKKNYVIIILIKLQRK